MQTIVVVVTVGADGKATEQKIEVGEQAQKHVLRKFNVTADPRVDFTKALCAALIQQQMDLCQAEGRVEVLRAADRSIEMIEQTQMQCVKANFVEA